MEDMGFSGEKNYTRLDLDKLNAMYEPPKKHSILFSSLSVVALLVLSLFGTLFYSFQVSRNELNTMRTDAAPKKTAAVSPVADHITIGTDATFPPMEFVDPQGNLVGYDIDLGNKLATTMNAKVTFKNIPWDNLFAALENKEVDMILSSVTITEERRLKYLFSEPYLNAGQVIVTRKTDSLISAVDNLKGKRVGVQKGTTNETEARKYTDTNLVLSYADFEEAANALTSNKIDAIIADLAGAKGIIDKHPALKISSDPFTSEYYGVVLNKENVQLTGRVNEALSKLQQQGILTDLKHNWFE